MHELFNFQFRTAIIIHGKTLATTSICIKRYDHALDALPAEHGLDPYQEGPSESHSK
jgi:hypothetical protein